MPDYTHNELIVYGVSNELKYFYERNRISEEDAKYMENVSVCGLSFEKMCPCSITKVMNNYIKEKYDAKSASDDYDRMCTIIWGTKWDACNVMVDLYQINDKNKPHITYLFHTAWHFPENWLITISLIFPHLTFTIKHSNEYDGYDQTTIDQFKNGIKTNIETYSAVLRCIEENGGIENVVDMIIQYCTNKNIMIYDYSNNIQEKISWIIYCKKIIKEYEYIDGTYEAGENELVSDLLGHIDDFLDEKNLHHSLYINSELCILFVEKVKNINKFI